MAADLASLPEDLDRVLAVVAHPDDMEYGAASAVARWTSRGIDVRYLVVTRGEAGISSQPPEEVAPLRVAEQQASCAAVGVTHLEFLDHPDGLIVADLDLRRDIARAIRAGRPNAVVSINYRDTWGGHSWNHADHRAVGVALLDAVRDAANPWLFRDAGEAWDGVRFAAFGGSPQPTHAVDVTEHIDAGIASLRCHATYLAGLGESVMAAPGDFLRDNAARAGPRLGVPLAVTFEVVDL
jgi:LmbE family N-acetylglucosaminyl deacetylase